LRCEALADFTAKRQRRRAVRTNMFGRNFKMLSKIVNFIGALASTGSRVDSAFGFNGSSASSIGLTMISATSQSGCASLDGKGRPKLGGFSVLRKGNHSAERLYPVSARPAKPMPSIAQVDGSGTPATANSKSL
jgi:hypothetical protein